MMAGITNEVHFSLAVTRLSKFLNALYASFRIHPIMIAVCWLRIYPGECQEVKLEMTMETYKRR